MMTVILRKVLNSRNAHKRDSAHYWYNVILRSSVRVSVLKYNKILPVLQYKVWFLILLVVLTIHVSR